MFDSDDDDDFLVIPKRAFKVTTISQSAKQASQSKEVPSTAIIKKTSTNDAKQTSSSAIISQPPIIVHKTPPSTVKAHNDFSGVLTNIYKSIYMFFKILNESHTPIVKNWNIADVTNALKWSRLVQDTYKIVHGKPFYPNLLVKLKVVLEHWKLDESQNAESYLENAECILTTVRFPLKFDNPICMVQKQVFHRI
jgi:hypothetical protein